MTWLEQIKADNEKNWREICKRALKNAEEYQKRVEKENEELRKQIMEQKEATMQVSYNGFAGELVKLEQCRIGIANEIIVYDLSIYDSEKQVTHSFTGVKLEDVKFIGGAVSFGG